MTAAQGRVELAVAAVTDPGLTRAVNEDSYLAEAPVFVVADGMGGHEAGDLASAAVISAFRGLLGTEFAEFGGLRDALIAADDQVAEVAADTISGAGSTVTGIALTLHEGVPHWLVFNVGDSRVYRRSGDELVQLTVDHSLAQELIDRGQLRREDIPEFAGRNVITRAIGAADSMADSWIVPVVTGDRLLVCSDGLHSEVDDEAIRGLLTAGRDADATAHALVDLAKDNGGRDNISVIVVDVLSGGGEPGVDASNGADVRSWYEDTADTLPV